MFRSAKIKFIIMTILICLNSNIYAATGCRNGTGAVYTTTFIFFGGTYWDTPVNTNCPLGSTTSTQYANVTSTSSTNCTIYLGGLSTTTGKIVTYGLLNCPIDDFIPFLILATGALGAVYLRKNKKYTFAKI
jgi:hypothetical protein